LILKIKGFYFILFYFISPSIDPLEGRNQLDTIFQNADNYLPGDATYASPQNLMSSHKMRFRRFKQNNDYDSHGSLELGWQELAPTYKLRSDKER
jgi:hypothetical protein